MKTPIFQPKEVIHCVFGSRVKPAPGSKDHYWSSLVTVIQVVRDKTKQHCYIVDDEKSKTVAIAVVDSHNQSRSLRVGQNDYIGYSDNESRYNAMLSLKQKLS